MNLQERLKDKSRLMKAIELLQYEVDQNLSLDDETEKELQLLVDKVNNIVIEL